MLAISDLFFGFLDDLSLLFKQVPKAVVFWTRNAQVSMLLESVFEHRVELIKFALEQLKLLQDGNGLNLNSLVQVLQAIVRLEGDIMFQCLTIKANSKILKIRESIFDS